ncbi:MAG: hypothetical protein EBW87_03955 [Burkholderiaceae bacterium]|jgi:hypothetical protein|nr:hypothetical protein [Burkholderiaceae bacterium]
MADNEEFKFPDETEQKKEDTKELQFEVEGDSEIEVVDDTPEEDRDRPPMKEPPAEVTEEELAQYSSEKLKNRIQHFSKGYHEERRAKEAAIREREEAVALAQKLIEENKKLQSSHGQTQQVLIEQAKVVVANEIETAKKKFKEAYESGDSEAMTEAQELLTAAKIKAERVNNFKPAPLQAKETEVKPEPEQLKREQKLDPKVAAWYDANPWFGKADDLSQEMTAVALTVHKKLVESGFNTNSDEYFDRINTRIRQVFPDAFPSEKPIKKSAPVVAPATRSTAPKKIVLTKSQVNIAKRLGLTNEQYARAIADQMRNQNG